MRLVPLKHLKVDSKVAIDVVNKKGVSLVCAGEVLTERSLKKLDELSLSYVYIEDEHCINNEIDVYSISRIRDFYEIIQSLHKIADTVANGNSGLKEVNQIKQISTRIVEDILRIPTTYDLKIMYEPVKLYDSSVVEQSIYVAIMSVVLGVEMGLKKIQLVELCVTGLVRNFSLISPKVIYENVVYEGEELEKMHPILSHVFLSKHYDFSINVLEGVLHHHEYYNGSGFPYGLVGEEIHLYARIIGIVNFFYELKADNDPLIVRHGILEVVFKSKLRLFDPEIVEIFLKHLELFTLDTMVQLTTGDCAIVTQNNSQEPFRPIVRIIKNKKFSLGDEIDLSEPEHKPVKITTVIYYAE